MQKVKFKGQFSYSPDGLTNKVAKKGEVLDVSDNVARSAVSSGAGVIVDEDDKEQAVSTPETEQEYPGGDSEGSDVSEDQDDGKAADGDPDADKGRDEKTKQEVPARVAKSPVEDKKADQKKTDEK